MVRLPRVHYWIMPYLPGKTGTVYHRRRAFFIGATALLQLERRTACHSLLP